MRATAKEFLSIIVRVAKRALCNGKTSAFQADDAGSIPAARSIIGEVYAHIAQSVEHFLGKEEVTGSNPVMSSNLSDCKVQVLFRFGGKRSRGLGQY